MTASMQGVVLFCDDVRDEVGGKSSLMGVLGPEVWVGGSEMVVYCVFLLWTSDPEIKVVASFDVENAPPDVRIMPGFERTVSKDESDESDRWMVQMKGRYPLKLGDGPLALSAKFEAGGSVFWNRLIVDPNIPDDYEP